METKQTALEWLENNLNFEPYDEEEFINNNKIWEQAKQMEKEQIMDSYEYGNCDWEFGIYIKGEQYYNETYGN
jgi:hypothetical protein